MTLTDMGKRAKDVPRILNTLGSREKNMGLEEAARALLDSEEKILTANKEDYDKTEAGGMNQRLLDRLRLTPARVQAMADDLLWAASLNDPVGEVLSMKLCLNGLQIRQKRVFPSVTGMIYEVRPNVTMDVFGLCFKSGNAAILKGGSDALSSNRAIVEALRVGLSQVGLPEDSLQLIEDISRETTKELVHLNRYTDVLISRGGAGLIRTVAESSTILVIETETGNYHMYANEIADLQTTLNIIFNTKTQRIGACDAYKSLPVHEKIAERFLPILRKYLDEEKVETCEDEDACAIVPGFVLATEEDWRREHLDYILFPKIVDSVDEAISYINTYNTSHSKLIVTSDYFNAQRSLNEVDVAAVYVSASVCFTGGNELSFGAKIDISTRKFHARGPMGLRELTTTEYIIYEDGQIR